jgi:hypothetical protein
MVCVARLPLEEKVVLTIAQLLQRSEPTGLSIRHEPQKEHATSARKPPCALCPTYTSHTDAGSASSRTLFRSRLMLSCYAFSSVTTSVLGVLPLQYPEKIMTRSISGWLMI